MLPETEAILKRAAGGSNHVPTLLDEVARIIGQLKDVAGDADVSAQDGEESDFPSD